MSSEAFTYISSMPHFSFLPEEERRRIAESVTVVRHPAGTRLATQGRTTIDSIFIPVEGALVLYIESGKDKTLSGYIKPGDVFGGISILLNGGISLRTVEVDQDCAGYTVDKDVFLNVCARSSDFFDYFLENFSKNMFDPSLSALIETGQVRRFLANIEPFSFLPGGELDRITGEVTIVQYPEGTIPFVQGATRIGFLYILQEGSVERFFEEKGTRTMQELMEEGDIYGGISMLLLDGISVRTVKILERSTFYLLPKRRFLELCRDYESVTEFFTDIFGKRMLEKSYASIVAKTMAPGEEGLQFFNQHVASIYSHQPIFGTVSLTIREAAEIMAGKKIGALFLKSEEDTCVGVVTERDLTHRVIAAGYDIQRPVSDIMSSPVLTVSEFALIFEALMVMMEKVDSSCKCTTHLIVIDFMWCLVSETFSWPMVEHSHF